MSLQTLKQILVAAEKDNPGSMLPIRIKELGDLILAAETLRMVAGDMAILKAALSLDRGRVMVRKSDLITRQELAEMITTSVASLSNLGAEDIYSDDVGEYVFERLIK